MIESIAISNFYCFNETTQVSFVAGRERSRALDDMYSGFTEQNRVNLLKMVYIYGNNGAGKSKLLMAFDTLKELVTVMRDDKTDRLPYHPFALDTKNTNCPSHIELVYHFDGRHYRYTIEWNERAILKEMLTLLKPSSEQQLFSRQYDTVEKIVKVNYNAKAMEIDDDTQYVIKTALLKNNSVISSITNTNIYNRVLHDQLSFFRHGFELLDFHNIDLGNHLPDDKMHEGRELKKVILALLKSIGSNITNFEKIPLPKRIPSYFSSRMKNISDEEREMLMEWMDMSPDYAVKTFHRVGTKKVLPLDLDDQSEGTQEILRLILCMHQAIAEHKTILLDDCINGIHPKTLEQLMKFYLGASSDAQLIIASQNFSNLDDPLIRRDSLRFVVKDEVGQSHVNQLTLGDLHKNQNLRHQIENSERWGVKPAIDELVLEAAIAEYREKLVYDTSFYYSELI